jgi:Ras-related protein Rab-1A
MISIKVILIGDSGVGKTCLIQQYTSKEFTEEHITTIAAGDKSFKEVKVGEKTLKLEIWDTVGQEKFKSVNKIYMNQAKIALIVYDMTDQNSFNNLKNWYQELKDKNDSVEIIGVIANKSDLYEDKVIDKEEGENYAKSINALFFETSAMDYESVAAVFEGLAKKYVEKKDKEDRKREEDEQKKIKLEPSKHKEEKEKDQNYEKGASIRRSNIF